MPKPKTPPNAERVQAKDLASGDYIVMPRYADTLFVVKRVYRDRWHQRQARLTETREAAHVFIYSRRGKQHRPAIIARDGAVLSPEGAGFARVAPRCWVWRVAFDFPLPYGPGF